MRKLFLLFIVFAVLVLGIISFYNAMTTFSKQLNIKALSLSKINDTLAYNRLSSAIRIPIVNNPIDSIFIGAEQKFPEFLREAFPNFHNDPSVSIMGFGSNSLLYRWKGRDAS